MWGRFGGFILNKYCFDINPEPKEGQVKPCGPESPPLALFQTSAVCLQQFVMAREVIVLVFVVNDLTNAEWKINYPYISEPKITHNAFACDFTLTHACLSNLLYKT